MTLCRVIDLNRREVLAGAGATAVAAGVPRLGHAAVPGRRLVADMGREVLKTGSGSLPIDAWCYGGSVPGPILRYRRGERLDVNFENRLAEPSTVHWHGLRPPNGMDGAAPLTQPPVPSGERFRYVFDLNDAGTYWYHTHFRAWNQQDRGLYGIVIVDEQSPPDVDRDLLLVLDDWVLTDRGNLSTNFGNLHEWAHAGRLGNLATINNDADATVSLRAGERVRLRLVNVANAQIFALMLDGHDPVVIAEDGNPVSPWTLDGRELLLGPGQRADLILDAVGAPSSLHSIRAYTLREEIRLGRFVYDESLGGSGLVGTDVTPLEANARPALDLSAARRLQLRMEGGAMSGMGRAMMGGRMRNMRELMRDRRVWAFNGVAGDMDVPLATLRRGETVVIEMINDTAFPHAMHLHGMHFREVARNGTPIENGAWRDTSLMASDDRVSIAFNAETPGKWMLHCHMVEHQAGGMMTFVEIEGDEA